MENDNNMINRAVSCGMALFLFSKKKVGENK